MKNLKKAALLGLALVLALSFAACSSSSESSDLEEAAELDSTIASEVVLKVGASPAPHAEVLEAAKPLLEEKGITLEIVEFDDYVLPNTALDEGYLDANYFQHYPYLELFNEANGTDIVSAAAIHYEPLGVYPGKSDSLENIAEGAQIGIPNDGSNEARALYLLEEQGLITMDHSVGFEATPMDIIDNPLNLEFVEMDADKLPAAVVDLDFAVINGNYAIAAGINETVLVSEDADSESASTYANIIAVRAGDETREDILALIEVLQSDEIKAFMEEAYQGSVVPMS